MRIELDPRVIAKLLAAAIVLLVIASLIGQVSTYYFDRGRLLGLVRLFAALFVGGALVVEMLSGWWFDQHGNRNMGFVLFWTTEEALEMTGVAVFLYALLRHLRDEVGAARLSFVARRTAAYRGRTGAEALADSAI